MAMPPKRVLTFFGSIRVPSTNSLRSSLCGLVNEGATHVTLLFSSDGGSTDDGISLYTYLKALPFELTMHAVGPVASIAVPVFLAAPVRLASRNAVFRFHEYNWTHPQPTVVTQASLAEHTAQLDHAIAWTKDVVKATTKLRDRDFQTRKMFKEIVLLDATGAVTDGLVSAVAEPTFSKAQEPRVVI